MLKLNNILCIETYGDKSKVVNPKIHIRYISVIV